MTSKAYANVKKLANSSDVEADFDAVADGVSDDTAEFQAAATANSGTVVEIPYSAAGYNISSITADNTAWLGVGKSPYAASFPPGIANGTAWQDSFWKLSGRLTTAASETMLLVEADSPIDPGADSQKNTVMFVGRNNYSTGSGARGHVVCFADGVLQSTATQGAVWGFNCVVRSIAGGEGSLVGAEFDVSNNSSDVTTPETPNEKVGLKLSMKTGRGTAAMIIQHNPSTADYWNHGVYIKAGSIKSGGMAWWHNGSSAIRDDGFIMSGSSTFDAQSGQITAKRLGASNAVIQAESISTQSAYFRASRTATLNWSFGQNASGAFVIARGLDLSTGKVFEAGNATIGVYGATPVAKPTVTGSRGGNAALESLLTALASIGWITDSSSA